MDDADKVFVDLKTYNENKAVTGDTIVREHMNIMGSQPIRTLLDRLIKHESADNIPHTSIARPSGTHYIMAEKHSPVDMNVYDADGNHTGLKHEMIDGTDTIVLEEGIPNSSYIEMGGSAYIIFPALAGTRVTLSGTGEGTVNFKLTEYVNDVTVASTTFRNIPVTASSTGSVTVGTIANSASFSLDENGDGTIDFVLNPNVNGETIFPKTSLTLTADNKTITLGEALPPLTATLSGFLNSDDRSSSFIGEPDCATTATETSPSGIYPITCTAGTLSSNLYEVKTFVTGTLVIAYRFDGFLQPINDTAYHPDQSLSIFKGGSTVPVKFQIKKADGTPVQANTLPAFSFQRGNTMSASVDESTYSDLATSGSLFRWDNTSQQYVYNWSTKGIAPGYWYKISTKLDDGKTYSVVVGLR